MFLDDHKEDYIGDTAISFSAAIHLGKQDTANGETVNEIWPEFVIEWSHIYFDYLNSFKTNQPFVFNPHRFWKLAEQNVISIRLSNLETYRF